MWHDFNSFKVSSSVPKSCLLFRMCSAQALVGLLVRMYRTFSLCLTAMDLADCPMYALLHVLHFNSYIPLGLFWVGFSVNCWYVVFVVRRAILRLDCLKRLVTFLTSGLW